MDAPLAFSTSVGSHWATLVSGGATFLIAMWFAHRGKTVAFRVFVSVSIFALLVAAYQAWEDEYIKNLGQLYFTFNVVDARQLKDENVEVNLVFVNTTQRDFPIRNLVLSRVIIDDHTLFRNLNPISYCKKTIWFDPGISFGNDFNNIKFQDEDVFYSWLQPTEIFIDDTQNRDTSFTIERGKVKIVSVKYAGSAINPEKFNDVAICPGLEHRPV